MKRTRQYQAFTLVEMLVVMGILVILMAMGIAAGRFAIQRANRVQHQNAADQIFQALQSYYADNREFPTTTDMASFDTAMATGGALNQYLDNESYDGGSDATFYYLSDDASSNQSMLVCVSYSANNDEADMGGYCNGNGFGQLPASSPVTKKILTDTEFDTVINNFEASNWNGKTKAWE